MTMQNSAADADRALKSKHRAMWAQGDYPSVAAEVIPELGAILVEACGVRSGLRVLDVGAGSGNAAIPAALAGADVVASDLTPELFEAGRAVAEKQGARLTWQEADARPCPSATPSSTPCCPASASCSPRTTSRPPTSWSGSAVPAAPSGC